MEKGDRIELIYTDDSYTDLEKGDRGTVTGTSEIPAGVAGQKEHQIHVDWDNGSNLSLIRGRDSYKIIEEEVDA